MGAALATSANRISGDAPLGASERVRYLLACARDMARGSGDARLPRATLELPARIPKDVAVCASPSRLYAEVLWRSLPWASIGTTLGPVRVLEVGCGSGSRFRMLARVLGGALEAYVGVDVRAHAGWEAIRSEDPRASFLILPAEDLPSDVLASANLIASQSVLEHLEGDLAFFRAHRAAASGRRFLQVHVVPAPAALLLYLWHGYRQYPAAALVWIASVYPDAHCSVAALGGVRSNLLHLGAITMPAILGARRRRRGYEGRLRACYAAERRMRSRAPSAYALFIERGLEPPLLAGSGGAPA